MQKDLTALKKRIDDECEKHPECCHGCLMFENSVWCFGVELHQKEHIEKIEKLFNEIDNEKNK